MNSSIKMLNISRLVLLKSNTRHVQKCWCSKLPKELTTSSDKTREVMAQKVADKKDLQWRTPWHEKEGQYYSMLRTFYSEDSNAPLLKLIQQPINLSPTAIKNWWLKRKETQTIALQQYLPERNEALGDELAAAHFIVHRGGTVKFYGDDKWIKSNALGDYSLPSRYEEDMYLQAIDCTDMELYYEGLANLRNLKQVEWLSLSGCENLDDWALDRISHLFEDTLLYLDLRDMPMISHRGLGALYKMNKLKILYVDQDIYRSREFEMVCLMLQDVNPDLDVRFD